VDTLIEPNDREARLARLRATINRQVADLDRPTEAPVAELPAMAHARLYRDEDHFDDQR
jgi:hypothetical protein